MRGSRHEPETPWASFSDVLSRMLFVFVITTFWFAWRLAMAELPVDRFLEARVDRERGVGFQVFGETGNVFPTTNAMRLSGLREVAGVGLNWQSPVDPIRLDWGFKLGKRPSEDRHVFHLAVGYAF